MEKMKRIKEQEKVWRVFTRLIHFLSLWKSILCSYFLFISRTALFFLRYSENHRRLSRVDYVLAYLRITLVSLVSNTVEHFDFRGELHFFVYRVSTTCVRVLHAYTRQLVDERLRWWKIVGKWPEPNFTDYRIKEYAKISRKRKFEI